MIWAIKLHLVIDVLSIYSKASIIRYFSDVATELVTIRRNATYNGALIIPVHSREIVIKTIVTERASCIKIKTYSLWADKFCFKAGSLNIGAYFAGIVHNTCYRAGAI